MKVLGLALVASAALMVCPAHAISGEHEGVSGALSVDEVVEKRFELEGRKIKLHGFANRGKRLTFIFQGRAYSAQGIEKHWCNSGGAQTALWFRRVKRGRAFLHSVPQDDTGPISGRQVIVEALLTAKAARSMESLGEVNMNDFTELDAARAGIGPLEQVRIVAVLPEVCSGGPPIN